MALTVIVRGPGGDTRLTFDGTQRVVIGRGASCDVRLPDPSVSHRHASLRAQGGDFVLVDEGSSNGTFVGGVRIAPRTSRIVRSGDMARLGRVWIELRVDQSPTTRDVAAATRDLALALVAQAMDAAGRSRVPRVVVLEGHDQGAAVELTENDRPYVVGRAPSCDLPLGDGDTSREHLHVIRRAAGIFVRDLGAKNGSWLGDYALPTDREAAWRSAQMVRVGRTVLALEEPLVETLARIEEVPDEPLPPDESAPPPPASSEAPASTPAPEPEAAAPVAAVPTQHAPAAPRPRHGWSAIDFAVVAAAVSVLALSLAGLVWLLRG
ncbi:MAG TPA: FHA domain-containing protein [Polyangiaceae bacterium]|nr:FHA domain-containing protein [Polyangiaceae bacterium]